MPDGNLGLVSVGFRRSLGVLWFGLIEWAWCGGCVLKLGECKGVQDIDCHGQGLFALDWSLEPGAPWTEAHVKCRCVTRKIDTVPDK